MLFSWMPASLPSPSESRPTERLFQQVDRVAGAFVRRSPGGRVRSRLSTYWADTLPFAALPGMRTAAGASSSSASSCRPSWLSSVICSIVRSSRRATQIGVGLQAFEPLFGVVIQSSWRVDRVRTSTRASPGLRSKRLLQRLPRRVRIAPLIEVRQTEVTARLRRSRRPRFAGLFPRANRFVVASLAVEQIAEIAPGAKVARQTGDGRLKHCRDPRGDWERSPVDASCAPSFEIRGVPQRDRPRRS